MHQSLSKIEKTQERGKKQKPKLTLYFQTVRLVQTDSIVILPPSIILSVLREGPFRIVMAGEKTRINYNVIHIVCVGSDLDVFFGSADRLYCAVGKFSQNAARVGVLRVTNKIRPRIISFRMK